ncbi:unnamed protein product [Periconia digitata]|uniref:Pyridoxamine 5'-phosphate oxidase putative domain-containing protein n=1 Tax=Periconia digitata TaxID=1303443 RepID=A0A9W4XHA5_9PLEO|nr:unnamed protein product [Periconia digitata]
MGVFYETIPDNLKTWILDQKMLWVGTAPLASDGHINISPKGGKAFGIPSPTSFWYLDLTGSGVETLAHLHEPGNARICIMFLAFEGAPKIIRLWGHGRAVENGTPEFDALVEDYKIQLIPGARSVVVVDVHQVASSCGFSVPYYEWKGWRSTLDEHFAKKDRKFRDGDEKESMDRYWAWKSQLSIDGLPGMKRGYQYAQHNDIAPLKKMIGKYAPDPKNPRTVTENASPIHVLMVGLLCFVIGVVLTLTMVDPEIIRKVQKKELFI